MNLLALENLELLRTLTDTTYKQETKKNQKKLFYLFNLLLLLETVV